MVTAAKPMGALGIHRTRATADSDDPLTQPPLEAAQLPGEGRRRATRGNAFQNARPGGQPREWTHCPSRQARQSSDWNCRPQMAQALGGVRAELATAGVADSCSGGRGSDADGC
jgi:hypothetical protein